MTVPITRFAPAKINLTLHVTGQRTDGYHLLDSLVVFVDVGDHVTLRPADQTRLTVTGPMAAGVPVDAGNLVMRAADLMGASADITLDKHLPAASGIGGGSSDAAATLRGLADIHDLPLPEGGVVARLGADVPVCLLARATRMGGIGDQLQPLAGLPPVHMVLVNPGVAVSTPDVFAALSVKTNAPMPGDLPDWADTAELAQWLKRQRNDLELPARTVAPAVGVALMRITQTEGCLLARMSGSGATCFGLYASRVEADMARDDLAAVHPDWWIRAASSWAP